MKRIFFTLALLVLLIPAARLAQARTDVSLDFFYNNLESQGQWIDVGNYGYCFQPTVEASDPNWRPYSDGYWAHTDAGWTWVSYEDFGWATYHYGRWTRLHDYGWVWVPGTTWGPAWVSWRTGGDYVGWAPLPPESERFVQERRVITGHVDLEFDIGPSYYNFCDVRYIGEPVLRDRLFEPERNVTIINNTVNVTNITYNNSNVYNGGPDYNRLNSYSTRPIQQLRLERSGRADMNVAAAQPGNYNRVQGNKLLVMAPAVQRSAQVAPPRTVKAKVERPQIDRGWVGVPEAQMKAKYKKESAKQIPPPTVAAHAPNAVAQPAAALLNPAPVAIGHKGKHAEAIPPASTLVAPRAQPGVNAPVPAQPALEKKGKQSAKAAQTSPPVAPALARPAAPLNPAAAIVNKGRHPEKAGAAPAPLRAENPAPIAQPKITKAAARAEAIHPAAEAMRPAIQPSSAAEAAGKKIKHGERALPPEAQAAPIPRAPSISAGPQPPVRHRVEQAPVNREPIAARPVAPAPERRAPEPRPQIAPERGRPAAPAPAQPAQGGEKKKHKGEPEPANPAG